MAGRTTSTRSPAPVMVAAIVVALGVGVLVGRSLPSESDTAASSPASAIDNTVSTAITTDAAPAPPTTSDDEARPAVDNGDDGEPGTWRNVTPDDVPLTGGTCDSYGTQTVGVDPQRPSDLYTLVHCHGIWKSTDFGETWTGPINTGMNGAVAGDCAGGIVVAAGDAGDPPILYQGCIRGAGQGFSRSMDGGVHWTPYEVAQTPDGRQDFSTPVVDPYDSQHLLMTGHEFNMIVESTDGGENWVDVPMDPGMLQPGGTAHLSIVDTGEAATTRTTWLYTPQGTGGEIGTWRTTDGGASWTEVESFEGPHGMYQPYQPDAGGVLYLAGENGSDGTGVYRSDDYGETWSRVGEPLGTTLVFGTPNRVYAAYSWACGDCDIEANFQSAEHPGTDDWSRMDQPSGMSMGPARTATTFDGSNYIIVSANWRDGLWRYVEPADD